jgi:hypothetical protein
MDRLSKAPNRTGTRGLAKPKSQLPSLFVQGATFGLSDEISGLAGALADAVAAPLSSRVDFNPKKSYEAWRDRERERVATTRKENPWLGTGMELLGGITTLPTGVIKGAGNLKNAVKAGAKTGSVQGGVAGFGYGEGGSNSAVGAGLGAATGGVLGAAIPALVRPIARGVTAARDYVSPRLGVGREIVARAIAEDKLTPRQAGQALQEARGRGVPLMLGDLGDNLRGLTGSLSRKPGPSRTLIKKAVDARQMGQGERVRSAIERDLGPIPNTLEVSDDLIASGRAAAAPLYEQAYAAPAVTTPEIESLLSTPFGRSALARARVIAANERRNPATLGFALDDSGNVVLNPVGVNQHGAVAAARSELDQASGILEAARRRASGGAGNGSLQPLIDREKVARMNLDAAMADLNQLPTAGVASEVRGYTPQTLDYVKRGMDDVLEERRDQFGRLRLDEAGRAENAVRANFLNEVDRLNPAYAAARAAYAGPASANQAMLAGKKAANASPEEIERMIAGLPEANRGQFALGYRSALGEVLDRRVDGADKVTAMLGSPRKRAALARAMGANADLERFLTTMGDERMANETYRAVSTGSPTANRLADDALTGDDALFADVSGKVLKGATNGGWAGGLAELIGSGKDILKFGGGQTGQRAREDAAALLSEIDPQVLQEAMREALRQQALRRVGQRGVDRAAIRSGGLLGRAAGGISAYGARPVE